MSELGKEIARVYVGDQTFDAFARRTRGQWYGLATMLLRHHPAPVSVEAEDVVQVMLLGAWKFLQRYDFARSPDVGRFVQWNAIKRGRRYLLEQRRQRDEKGAHRPPIPVPVSWLSDSDSSLVRKALAEPAERVDNLLVAREERRRHLEVSLSNCRSDVSRTLVREFARTEDLERAAELVERDAALALTLDAWDRPAARRAARRAAEEAATWQPEQQQAAAE